MAPDQLTSTKAMLGSPLYMSPEQLRSSKNVDARADIWAMGVILYELAHRAPCRSRGDARRALRGDPRDGGAAAERHGRRTSRRASTPIVARCLQRRPEHRYSSVAELERDLAPFASRAAAAYRRCVMTAAMPLPRHAMHGARISAGTRQPHLRHAGDAQEPLANVQPGPAGLTGAMPSAAALNTRMMAQSASGSNPQLVAPGAMPLGAVTPQPYRQTGNAWQNTGAAPAPKSSNGPSSLAFGASSAARRESASAVRRFAPPRHVVLTQGSAADLVDEPRQLLRRIRRRDPVRGGARARRPP